MLKDRKDYYCNKNKYKYRSATNHLTCKNVNSKDELFERYQNINKCRNMRMIESYSHCSKGRNISNPIEYINPIHKGHNEEIDIVDNAANTCVEKYKKITNNEREKFKHRKSTNGTRKKRVKYSKRRNRH